MQSTATINPTTNAMHTAPTKPIVFDENLVSGALVIDLLNSTNTKKVFKCITCNRHGRQDIQYEIKRDSFHRIISVYFLILRKYI